MARDTTSVGNVTEGVVLASLLKAGKTVLIPFGSQADYDLVIVDDNKYSRVQCKTGKLINGVVIFSLYTVTYDSETDKYNRRPYGDKIDFYAIYCPQTGDSYLVPRTAVGCNKGYLRVDPPKNCQQSKIKWANDFKI